MDRHPKRALLPTSILQNGAGNSRVAQPIPRGRAGHLVRLVRGIVWVTESQEDWGETRLLL